MTFVKRAALALVVVIGIVFVVGEACYMAMNRLAVARVRGDVVAILNASGARATGLDCSMSALSRDGYCTFSPTPNDIKRIGQAMQMEQLTSPDHGTFDPSAGYQFDTDIVAHRFGDDHGVQCYELPARPGRGDRIRRVSGIFDIQFYYKPATRQACAEVGY